MQFRVFEHRRNAFQDAGSFRMTLQICARVPEASRSVCLAPTACESMPYSLPPTRRPGHTAPGHAGPRRAGKNLENESEVTRTAAPRRATPRRATPHHAALFIIFISVVSPHRSFVSSCPHLHFCRLHSAFLLLALFRFGAEVSCSFLCFGGLLRAAPDCTPPPRPPPPFSLTSANCNAPFPPPLPPKPVVGRTK